MRREVLHKSHQGSVHTKSRAHLLVFWPGLDNDLDNIIFSCKHCQASLPKEPILLKPKPTRPFQEIALDFVLTQLTNFISFVDCFSDWPEIIHGRQHCNTSPTQQIFCRSGAPDIVWSDRAPQFTSNFFLWSGASCLPLPTPRVSAKQKQLLSP